jgi:ornithine cyclodeaminase/alanine dehydrogenase-like protein (mu-crystallin family)
MAILISEMDVRAVLSRPDSTSGAIATMERFFHEQALGRLTVVPRIQLGHPEVEPQVMPQRSLRLMPSIGEGLGAACVRVYTTNKVGAAVETPSELLLLFDLETMKLRAMIEDRSLHTLRTAAPTAVATRYLARPDSRRIAVIGTGRHARGQLAAVASVCSVEETVVYGRNRKRLEHYCDEMGTILGSPVRPAQTPEEAVTGADVVIVATATAEPVLKGAWLEPGMHVNSIAPCELDAGAIERSRVFPAYTRQLTDGTPTWVPFPQMLAEGRLRRSDLETELCLVVAGQAAGRETRDEITLFLSTGMAGWDLAIALWIEDWAVKLGLGKELWDSTGGPWADGLVCPPVSPSNGV